MRPDSQSTTPAPPEEQQWDAAGCAHPLPSSLTQGHVHQASSWTALLRFTSGKLQAYHKLWSLFQGLSSCCLEGLWPSFASSHCTGPVPRSRTHCMAAKTSWRDEKVPRRAMSPSIAVFCTLSPSCLPTQCGHKSCTCLPSSSRASQPTVTAQVLRTLLHYYNIPIARSEGITEQEELTAALQSSQQGTWNCWPRKYIRVWA